MAYSFSMIGHHVYMDCVVCVTVVRSFACAPRWGVALVGFVSTERSSPRHGNPLFRYWSLADIRRSLEANSLEEGRVVAWMCFCIFMRTVTRNAYPFLYIGTTFGSNARICTICVS